MKKMLNISFGIYLILVSISFANPQHPITDEQKDVTTVIEVFLNALIEGDTETMRESLGGDLLNKRKKLLDNPDYPKFLENTYRDAHFEINGYKRIHMGKILVNVTVFLKNNETRKMKFLLIRGTSNTGQNTRFLIHSQIVN